MNDPVRDAAFEAWWGSYNVPEDEEPADRAIALRAWINAWAAAQPKKLTFDVTDDGYEWHAQCRELPDLFLRFPMTERTAALTFDHLTDAIERGLAATFFKEIEIELIREDFPR